MKWSYILFLPALVNIGWALATLLLKRRPLRSQLVLSVMLLVLGFAMTVLGIFFRGRAGSLFIYFYLFELTAIFCIPLYYVGVCSLTEPRGATLPERRVMSIPLLYSVVLTAGSFLLGPRKFEQLCLAMRDGEVAYLPGESAYNFMISWAYFIFPTLLIVLGVVMLFLAARREKNFRMRYNNFYANTLGEQPLQNHSLSVVAWCYLPICVASVFLIFFRPHFYKYWLIVCAVATSVVQWLLGHYVYNLKHDARYLGEMIRAEMKQEES